MERELIHNIFSSTKKNFDSLALDVFRFQYEKNPVYHQFVNALQVRPDQVKSVCQVPFLPIGFFKSHLIKTTEFSPEIIFESSGTTASLPSRHFVKESAIYQKSFLSCFEQFYGNPNEWCVIGLLPSYLERKNSSLIMMVSGLINMSQHAKSGFYLNDYQKLYAVLEQLEREGQKTMLIGVTFALLDFAEKYPMELKHTLILETGGMKGRREEMTREEVHDLLKEKTGAAHIHSEYGMTELLSQAWSTGNGIFRCPSWMEVLVRDEDDPLMVSTVSGTLGVRGVLNIIDLANIYSCSFLATDDVGKIYSDGSFSVLGRMDNSDIRGCSLMVL